MKQKTAERRATWPPRNSPSELSASSSILEDRAYEDKTDEGNAFAQAVQQAKAAGLKKGDKFKVGDEEHTLRDSDFEQVNTNTMENKEKEVVKEAIKISTDSPEEAGMMMQILALAGVKPVDASMMGGDQDQEHDHDGMKHSHPGGDQEHSHDDMRSMMDKIPSDDEIKPLIEKSKKIG